jgi:hypothetical protein
MGTVSETSGSHYPLANSGCHSLARAHLRSCIDPCDQNRACAERFKNNATHDPEHLPSYLDTQSFTPASTTTRSVVHAKLVIPRTRSPARFAATPRQGHLGSVRAMPSSARAFRRRIGPTKDTSGRRLQSHLSKTSTRCFARLPSRLPELPLVRCGECCGSRRNSLASAGASRSAASILRSPLRWSSVTSDAPVTARASPAH